MDQFYVVVKDIHFYLRWLILALAVIVFLKYMASWLGKKLFTSLDNKLSLYFVSTMDVQLLLGLLLYFFLSPSGISAFQHENTMGDATARLYAVEHPLTMLLAIIIAHAGRVMVKKSATDDGKFKRGTLYFGLALLFMLSRMPW